MVYKLHYIDPEVARKNEEEARKTGDFGAELGWSAKPLAASGSCVVGEPLQNDLFDFKPDTVRETLQNLHGNKE